jgi:hypothetical protein
MVTRVIREMTFARFTGGLRGHVRGSTDPACVTGVTRVKEVQWDVT